MGKKVGLLPEKKKKSTTQIKTKAIAIHLLALWACMHIGAHALLTQIYTQRRIEYITKYVPDKYVYL
jgi:hypothetical protein